jgi:hypothetical protein
MTAIIFHSIKAQFDLINFAFFLVHSSMVKLQTLYYLRIVENIGFSPRKQTFGLTILRVKIRGAPAQVHSSAPLIRTRVEL